MCFKFFIAKCKVQNEKFRITVTLSNVRVISKIVIPPEYSGGIHDYTPLCIFIKSSVREIVFLYILHS